MNRIYGDSDVESKLTAQSISRNFSRQGLSNIAWALAVFGVYPPNLMQIIYQGLFGVGNEQNPDHMNRIHGDSGLRLPAITNLIQVQMAMDLDGSTHGLKLPDDFPNAWIAAEKAQNTLSWRTSKLQEDVSGALTRMGFEHVMEHVIAWKDTEILSIDIANQENKIAIEVDGPTHFVMNLEKALINKRHGSKRTKDVDGTCKFDNMELNGSTILKHRMLEQLGWKVIHIPFWEWNALGGDRKKQDEYCRQLLK